MKNYLFQTLCLAACVAELIYRPFPGWGAIGAAWAVLLISVVLTAYGVKQAVDDMWWRIACAIVAPIILALATYQ